MIGPGAFKLTAPYQPTGDQPQAIEQLVKGAKGGRQRTDPAGGDRFREDLHHGQRDRPG